MKRVIIAMAIAMALGVSSASANYYYSKAGAQRLAKDYIYKKYGINRYAVSTSCRPQGAPAAASGYLYHRWVCGWYDGSSCGAVRIIGSSSSPGAYYGSVWRGVRSC
jgi:hypothetical protein